MQRSHEDNPRSVKYYVKNFLLSNKEYFFQKKVIDMPAGNGVTSRILKEIGAQPLPFDLFPEYFNVKGIECQRANILHGIPLEDRTADAFICQEGIEHFPDQLQAMRNFNRVLKMRGTLLITTPNYSNLGSRLSYFLSESEKFNSIMPPNEIDSIWMNDQSVNEEVYYGHIFLIGIQKLRVLAVLAGFRIKRILPARIKTTCLILFPVFYPFILLSNIVTYYKNLRKKRGSGQEVKESYRQVFQLSVKPRVLLDSHLIIEFEKIAESAEVKSRLMSMHQGFGLT